MGTDSIDELQGAYLSDKLIPVVGAGVSLPFKLPDWNELLMICAEKHNLADNLKKRLKERLDKYEYLEAADVILHAGVSEEELCQCVADTISVAKSKNSDGDKTLIKHNYSDLSRLSGVRYMTTNYDMYLNDYTGGKSFRITDLTRIPANRFQFKKYEKAIIPIHGEIADPNSIVLSRKSYETVYEDEKFEISFQHIRSSFVFLFIGFSFDDVYVKGMFEHILNKRLPSRHYILFAESVRESHSEKIAELKEKYGVVSVFYKTNGGDHSDGIREILHRITVFKDNEINVEDLPRIRSNKAEPIPDSIKIKMDEGERAREDENVSRVETLFTDIRHSEDYSMLSADVKIDIIANLMWCRGMVYDFDGAYEYFREITEDDELKLKKTRLAFLYAQTLWNLMRFEEAIDTLKMEGINGSKGALIRLFIDICEISLWRYKDANKKPQDIKVYDAQDWTDEYKCEAKQKYMALRDKYINGETYNLKHLSDFESDADLEYAYYWLGNVAGQVFHEHGDAVQFIHRAKEYNNRRIYDEFLAMNYLEIARQDIRYQKNTKAYQINRNALSKAWRCFRIAFRVEDEMLLKSMYKRSAVSFLDCLFMMNRFYEYEELWERAYDYLQKGEHEWLLKAEVDARYLYIINSTAVDQLSETNRLYIKCVRLYYLASYHRRVGDIVGENRLYTRILRLLDEEVDGRKRLEIYCEGDDLRFLAMGIDAAFFTGNVDMFHKYKMLSKKYDSKEDRLRDALELEMMGDWDGAETLLAEEYRDNPDVSTFTILNGCYLRHGEKCLSDQGDAIDDKIACRKLCRDKSHTLYEDVLSGKGAPLFDELSFYQGYILNEINIWRDISHAMRLYSRFYERLKTEPDILYEIEEVLKQIVFDFTDMTERIERNRKMLTISPLEVNYNSA